MGILSRENEVERLAREAGFAYLKREGQSHFLVANDGRRKQYLVVKHEKGYDNSTFQLFFPTRFPLANLPAGLCARVLLRSHELRYGSWEMTISESCEASLYVAACVPHRSVDTAVFATICTELMGEVESFAKELRDKFAYTMGERIAQPEPARQAGTGIATQHARYPAPRRD